MVDANTIAFDGIGALHVTFASALTSDDEGKPVKVSADKTVALAADDNPVHGKAIKVAKDGTVTVQLKGYIEFPYTGTTAPTVGYAKLVSDGTGVKVDGTNGREFLVVSVDTTNKIVGLFL